MPFISNLEHFHSFWAKCPKLCICVSATSAVQKSLKRGKANQKHRFIAIALTYLAYFLPSLWNNTRQARRSSTTLLFLGHSVRLLPTGWLLLLKSCPKILSVISVRKQLLHSWLKKSPALLVVALSLSSQNQNIHYLCQLRDSDIYPMSTRPQYE